MEGIAVDWMGNNLYWTDDGPKKTISVARLEKAAQTRKTLIEGKMTHPRAIVVDPLNGCGCLGGQGWLVGGHGCFCPQRGPAELIPHGSRGPRGVSARWWWLLGCDGRAGQGSSSSCRDGLGWVALVWLGGLLGRCVGLVEARGSRTSSFVSTALRAAGGFTSGLVEAELVALQISGGWAPSPVCLPL